ncbi:hypothetical protein [Nonomuraea roseola]|uniref:Uncharacterized protein n=1 Tax=Nonomuraea roseola TaxID=46179 RepID=A0ABV5PTQ0_9ACTN
MTTPLGLPADPLAVLPAHRGEIHIGSVGRLDLGGRDAEGLLLGA